MKIFYFLVLSVRICFHHDFTSEIVLTLMFYNTIFTNSPRKELLFLSTSDGNMLYEVVKINNFIYCVNTIYPL